MKTPDTTATSRPVELSGDSPELVAFALLRYLAQLEQQAAGRDMSRFDREWMLNAYAECLEAAQGRRKIPSAAVSAPAAADETAQPAPKASAKAGAKRAR